MPYLPKIPARLRPRFEDWADGMIARWPGGVRRNGPARRWLWRRGGPRPPLTRDERKIMRAALERHFILQWGWVDVDPAGKGVTYFPRPGEWRP